jgi:hypothetical protein
MTGRHGIKHTHTHTHTHTTREDCLHGSASDIKFVFTKTRGVDSHIPLDKIIVLLSHFLLSLFH